MVLGETGASHDQAAIEFEAFARPLWGLVPFWAGGGRCEKLEEIYRIGIVNGTNPESTEYWGDPEDYDQRLVEMPPLALGLVLAQDILWNLEKSLFTGLRIMGRQFLMDAL